MFLLVLFQCAQYLARHSGCYGIGWYIPVHHTTGPNYRIITDSHIRQYCTPTANETVLTDLYRSVNHRFLVPAGKVPENPCCSIVGNERNIERNRRIVTYRHKVRLRAEIRAPDETASLAYSWLSVYGLKLFHCAHGRIRTDNQKRFNSALRFLGVIPDRQVAIPNPVHYYLLPVSMTGGLAVGPHTQYISAAALKNNVSTRV